MHFSVLLIIYPGGNTSILIGFTSIPKIEE
jgi:hypothetical protein